MTETILRPWVWLDYRLAVLFTVVLPLVLWVWALVNRVESLQRLLVTYWKVASLLMITVYLMIPGWSVGFLTAAIARILIPLSLWFWVDLNEEVRELPLTLLKLVFNAWRWAVTGYCALGAIANLYFLNCFSNQTEVCAVWLEVPYAYAQLVHSNTDELSKLGFLGFLGAVGLSFYGLSLGYFLIFRLPSQGRSALDL